MNKFVSFNFMDSCLRSVFTYTCSLSIWSNHVSMAYPIGPMIFVATRMTPGKVHGRSKLTFNNFENTPWFNKNKYPRKCLKILKWRLSKLQLQQVKIGNSIEAPWKSSFVNLYFHAYIYLKSDFLFKSVLKINLISLKGK